MNNEETIIMQPQNNNQAQQIQNVDTPNQEEKKPANGNNIAAMTGAAVLGSVAGSAGTYAATTMFNKEQEEEQKQEEQEQEEEQELEAKVEEETPVATTTVKHGPKVEEKTETEEIPVTVDENGEIDYTGNAGADPVAQNPAQEAEPQPTPTSNGGADDSDEVQVLGVYENEAGQEMAVLTDGETVAAVVDTTGDGEANIIAVDENRNNQIEEGEVHDISDQHISMSQYEDAYLAQQQEQMQQEHETFAYNPDDQQDYNNDAPDLSFA